ncbi:MAG: hypothetical protein HKN08_05965 [Gammaproteobacteria bacterium]|nr:hypothetical protein [Gammaproteobacteria bacterium]
MFSLVKRPFVAALFIIFLVAGCQTLPEAKKQDLIFPQQDLSMTNPGWRSCSFRINWPQESDVRFEVDLLLAHQVIGPILEEYSDSIYRWRFHRRAARDNAGHQFSFIFYSGSDIAAGIIDAVNTSDVKRRLQNSSVIESSTCIPADDSQRLNISDTSDNQWPEPIKRHWPTYIMGVSMTWLSLIDDIVAMSVDDDMNIEQMVDEYASAEEQVTALWSEYGQHAFLHHLNAVFGYESLLIRY